MGPQTGHVTSITLIPMRSDVMTVEFHVAGTKYGDCHALFSLGEGANVTLDGKPCISIGELFEWLADHSCDVTIHPDPQYYGLSKQTDFVGTV